MKTFLEWLAIREMWYSNDKAPQRKPDPPGIAGTQPPKTQAPRPDNQVPGTTGFLATGSKYPQSSSPSSPAAPQGKSTPQAANTPTNKPPGK